MRHGPSELQTAHGVIQLPAFFPDATRGAVRTLDSESLERLGIAGLVVNTFHLRQKPGARVIAELGGIHRFMGFSGPILSDSGGFQIFSLLREDPQSGSVSNKGFTYRPEPKEPKVLLSPETSLHTQLRLGSDIVVCLDHCTHPDAPASEQRASVEHTVAWAKATRTALDRQWRSERPRPLLFAVIQGGTDAALRRECAERLLEIGFDGYGYGGWPLDERGELLEAVAQVAELVPPSLPLWGLGIGKPRHIARAFAMGYTLFDCVLPTRDARQGRLFVTAASGDTDADHDYLYILDRKHQRSPEPIEPGCPCLCCQRHSRAYLHHLFRVEDPLGPSLATRHNLTHYVRLMRALRERASRA